jgi:hypothetical protein
VGGGLVHGRWIFPPGQNWVAISDEVCALQVKPWLSPGASLSHDVHLLKVLHVVDSPHAATSFQAS